MSVQNVNKPRSRESDARSTITGTERAETGRASTHSLSDLRSLGICYLIVPLAWLRGSARTGTLPAFSRLANLPYGNVGSR
jgi:hypothetical protein